MSTPESESSSSVDYKYIESQLSGTCPSCGCEGASWHFDHEKGCIRSWHRLKVYIMQTLYFSLKAGGDVCYQKNKDETAKVLFCETDKQTFMSYYEALGLEVLEEPSKEELMQYSNTIPMPDWRKTSYEKTAENKQQETESD